MEMTFLIRMMPYRIAARYKHHAKIIIIIQTAVLFGRKKYKIRQLAYVVVGFLVYVVVGRHVLMPADNGAEGESVGCYYISMYGPMGVSLMAVRSVVYYGEVCRDAA